MSERDRILYLLNKKETEGLDEWELAEFSNLHKAKAKGSYWGDVWNNAKRELKGIRDVVTTLLGEGPEGEAGISPMIKGIAGGIGKTVLGGLQAIASPSMIPVGGSAPETPETRQLAQESTEAFKQAVKPVISPIQSFREAPITTFATDFPILTGIGKGAGALRGKVNPISQVPSTVGDIGLVTETGEQAMRTPTLQEAVQIATETPKVKGKLLAGVKSTLNPIPLQKKTIEGIKKPIQQAQDVFEGFKQQAIANAPKGNLQTTDFANSVNNLIKHEKDVWGVSDMETAINKIPKLKDIVFGDADMLTVKDAIDFSSELSRKMSKNAKAKLPSTLSIPEQDLLDIRRMWDSEVIGNLPELKQARAFYKPVIDDYNLLRKYANPTTIDTAVTGAFSNKPLIQEAAMRYLDPQLAKELGDFQRVYRKANLSPSTIPSMVDLVKRKEMSHLPKTTVNKQKLIDLLGAINGAE